MERSQERSQGRSRPKRRRRRKTPGVSLIRPQRGHGWRIQFKDPDENDRVRRRAIPTEWATTEDRRTDYCAREGERLASRRRELAEGAAPHAHKSVQEATAEWLATYPNRRTQETYSIAVRRLVEWTEGTRGSHRVGSLDDVRQSTLKNFRDDLRHTADRETSTINKWVRVVHTFFVWAIYKGYCPRLRVDDLVALKGWRTEVGDPIPLDPSQAKAIFEAVQRHDQDALAVARGQHRGVGPKHDTAAMPLLLLALLAGVRKREAVQLTWEHYRRDALDASGNKIGELIVPAHISKTKRRRVIPLDHSPGLRRYLNARLMATGGEATIAGVSYDQAAKMLIRLRETYGGPAEFTWQAARVTCSSYLTSAPSIFRASAHAQSASRLGHSWAIAQRHYASSIAGIAGDATTLEQALQIETHVKRAYSGLQQHGTRSNSAGVASSGP